MALPAAVRSSKEKPLFVLGVIFSGAVWLGVLITIVGALYALLVALGVFIAHSLFLANIRGNGVRVGPTQLPQLHESVLRAAKALGLEDMPEVFILQSGGVLNAFATKLFSRKFVILFSNLVDGCDNPKQLDFIVGHEVGHLAAGHLAWSTFLMPFRLLPWFGPAYSRACEYTCDRAGHVVSGDLEQSQRALVLLAGGRHAATHVNLQTFRDQTQETGSFFMAIHELVSSHPFLCKRAAALAAVETPDSKGVPTRNPFAYPLAPLLGFSVGGASSVALIVLIYVGAFAALGVSNYSKYFAAAKLAPPGLQVPVHQPTPGGVTAPPDQQAADDAMEPSDTPEEDE